MKTILLIDAGNSRLKWGIYHQGRLEPGAGLIYQKESLDQQLGVIRQSLAAGNHWPEVIVLANVAGASVADALEHWRDDFRNGYPAVKDESQLTIVNIIAQADAYGVKSAYRRPSALGADRWAGLVAARHYIEGDSCVIDCGTALTIDVLAANGDHKGGIIMPGWEMMKKSLVMNTDGILEVSHETSQEISSLLGCDTAEAIEAGCGAACAGAVEHIVGRYQHNSEAELQCILTGGAAHRLLPLLGNLDSMTKIRHEPDWVLKGLAVISDNIIESGLRNDSGQTA